MSPFMESSIIELQLAHQERNKVSAAYNHATYLPLYAPYTTTRFSSSSSLREASDMTDKPRFKKRKERIGPKPRRCWAIALLSLGVLGCDGAPSLPATVAAGDYGPARAYLERMIREEVKDSDPGLSIAIVEGQKVVWAAGFGMADVARQRRATADTVYAVASVSKVFTGMEAVRLAAQGKFALDEDVTGVLGDFRVRDPFGSAAPLTHRALLAHHSGLPSKLYGDGRGRVHDPQGFHTLTAQLPAENLAAPAQTLYRYSSLGYSVLGLVIERSSGLPFAEAMDRGLFRRLGMRSSSFEPSALPQAEMAQGFYRSKPLQPVPDGDLPANGMYSSANDLARFLVAAFSGLDGRAEPRVLSTKDWQAVLTPQFAGLPLDFGHRRGLAWGLSGIGVAGEQAAWHAGNLDSFRSHLSMLPKQRIGVVVLANSDAHAKLVQEVGTKALALAVQAKTGGPLPQVGQDTAVSAGSLATDPAPFEGFYAFDGEGLGEVRREGRDWTLRFQGDAFRLKPQADGAFEIRALLLGGLFSHSTGRQLHFAERGKRRFLMLDTGLGSQAIEQVSPEPVPAGWSGRLGRYRIVNPKGPEAAHFAELYEASGFLVLRVSLQPLPLPWDDGRPWSSLVLLPRSDSEAVTAGIGRKGGMTIGFSSEGDGAALTVSGLRFLRLPSTP